MAEPQQEQKPQEQKPEEPKAGDDDDDDRNVHHISSAPAVLITGGNGGIGLATALVFAAAGWNTYATVRDLNRAEALVEASKSAASSRRLHVVVMDVTNPASIDEGIRYVYGREGRIDCLVNNAGIGIGGPLEGTTDEDVQRIFSTNVFSVISASRAVIPYMRAAGKGTIVNVSSALSVFTWPLNALYCSTKAAVDGFASSLAKEVASFGIRVVTVNPRITKSSFGDAIKPGSRSFPAELYEEVTKDVQAAMSPALAAALPAETAAAAVFEAATDADKTRLRYYPDKVTEEHAAAVLVKPKHQNPTWY